MASLDLLLKALDTAHWEMSEAFRGLADEETWLRPHPRLLSVGELAAHVAYGEATWMLGAGGVESPFVTPAVRYYLSAVEAPFRLDLGAEGALEEVRRVHAACKSSFLGEPRDSEDPNPGRDGTTWGSTLEYMAFHVAYHTGQIYSVRHLLGHSTVDN